MTRKWLIVSIALVLALAGMLPAFAADSGIEVYTQFAGVKVYVDGVYKGPTEYVSLNGANMLRIALAPGSYRLRFEYPDYTPDEVAVTVPQDRFGVHRHTFATRSISSESLSGTTSQSVAKTGAIVVRSSPTLAAVELDGRRLDDPTDCTIMNVPVGKRRISTWLQSSERLTIEFELTPDAKVTVNADFFRKAIAIDAIFTVKLESTPPGAAILVDGMAMGSTPASLALPYGTHELAVTKAGYDPFRKTVSLTGNDKITVELKSQAQAVGAVTGSSGTAVGSPAKTPGAESEPIIPAKYLKSYNPSQTDRIAARDSFEASEKARALSEQDAVDRTLAAARLPGNEVLPVAQYIERIRILDTAVKNFFVRYAAAKVEGMKRIGALYDAELAATKVANPIDPWENDKDYAARLAPLVGPIEKKRAEDLSRYAAVLDREGSERSRKLVALLDETSRQFAFAVYTVQGPSVRYTVGDFDRDRKSWPVKVESTETDFPYSAQFEYSIAAEKDMAGAYKSFAAALSGATLAARIEYSYTATSDESFLASRAQRAVLYEKNSGRIFTTGGDGKIVFYIAKGDPDQRLRLPVVKFSGPVAGISITVDGKAVGVTPVDVSLEIGKHEIRAQVSDYRPWSGSVIATPGKATEVKLNMEPSLESMVFVEGGNFMMGSESGDSDEMPVHRVTVSPFYIGKCEVTQAQYQKIMGKNPSHFNNVANGPVEGCLWYGAVDFCNALSDREGFQRVYTIKGTNVSADFSKNGYRLPTEAEWEYAARGGTKSRGYIYSGSSDADSVAWISTNSQKTTHIIGSKTPNELGIYDMSGNVGEWCWDWYGNYSSSAQENPTGPTSGNYHVVRGGAWGGPDCHTSKREKVEPGYQNSWSIGFRMVRRADIGG